MYLRILPNFSTGFKKNEAFSELCKECVNMAIQVCWLTMTKWVVTGERKHLANTSSCKPQIPNWLDGRYRTQMWRLWWNFQKRERCWKSHYGRWSLRLKFPSDWTADTAQCCPHIHQMPVSGCFVICRFVLRSGRARKANFSCTMRHWGRELFWAWDLDLHPKNNCKKLISWHPGMRRA